MVAVVKPASTAGNVGFTFKFYSTFYLFFVWQCELLRVNRNKCDVCQWLLVIRRLAVGQQPHIVAFRKILRLECLRVSPQLKILEFCSFLICDAVHPDIKVRILRYKSQS